MKAIWFEDAIEMFLFMGARARAVVKRLAPGAGVLVVLLCGCHHKQVPPTLPAILKAPDSPPPTPEAPSMNAPPPDSLSAEPAVKVTEAKPKRRPRKVAPKVVIEPAVPIETASTASPKQVSPLGELSAGGESNPQNQREANDLILSSERRLDALLKTKTSAQEVQLRDQSREIRRFLEQARQALSTGDADGAKTLATKAKLLLDDLEKWAQQE